MIRTAIRNTLSALAAAALSLTPIGETAAGDQQQTPKLHPSQLQWAPTIPAREVKPRSPSGLATQQPSQQTTTQDWRWWQDYGGGN